MKRSDSETALLAAELLDELRSFRHVFRNMYRKQLNRPKIMTLQETLPEALVSYKQCLRRFIGLLKQAV